MQSEYNIFNVSRGSRCPHIDATQLQLPLADLCRKKQGVTCSNCDMSGPNLWICLNQTCLNIGCSEHYNDHSTKHYAHNPTHCIQANQSSQRIWCYKCEGEVLIKSNQYNEHGRLQSNESNDYVCNTEVAQKYTTINAVTNANLSNGFIPTNNDIAYNMNANGNGDMDSSADDECETDPGKFTQLSGLVGLQNIANTCYMNSALQALSNTPPLTGYFLECGDIVEANYEKAPPTSSQRKAGLAKSYHRFVQEMWLKHKRKDGKFGYIVPSGILYSIRNVHPMFRGFQQHDTQEFLRCFMDQLHEELKEVTLAPPDLLFVSNQSMPTEYGSSHASSGDHIEDDASGRSTPSQSCSEAEYETCDSGVSEQSSLSDELSANSHRSIASNAIPSAAAHQTESTTSISNYSRSPSPTASQRTFKSTHSTTSTKSARSSSISSLNSSPINGPQSQQTPAPHLDPTDKQCGAVPSSDTSIDSLAATKQLSRSIISDVFDGKLLSSVQCLTCDRISTREETFQDLSLPIPGKDHLSVLHQSQGILSPLPTVLTTDPTTDDGWISWLWHWVRSMFWGPAVTLHDCMSAFFSADELKGDNMYSCEKCNKLRNGMKFSRVLELPEMLCVHLKRFRHDLSYSSKISSPVRFPLSGLDMRPYLHEQCKSKVSTYDLTAIICHHGTVGSGHYTSFAKHDISGKWFEYDDQLVTEVPLEVVQNCEAYVLFYRKCDPQMMRVRERAIQIEDMTAEQTSSMRFFVSRQWLNRFKTFAEPGPIDNWTLLCPHGGLTPQKARIANRLVVPLPQPLWDYLFRTFGGGPVCNHLFECDICRQKKLDITRRQNHELDEFSAYKDETTPTIYAISMQWFRQWQLFVGALTDDEPGPINNNCILGPGEGGTIRPGSDYAQINSTLWKFFYSTYGGGPEIVLRGSPANDPVVRSNSAGSNGLTPNKDDEGTAAEPTADTQQNDCVSHTQTNSIPGQPMPMNGQALHFKESAVDDNEMSVSQQQSADEKARSGGSLRPAPSTLPAPASPSHPTTTSKQKAVKYVSFEDNDSSTSSDRDTSSTNEHLHMRRGKHNYSAGPANSWEILSKKDRRHRSIQSNGFFGPEGKYSSNNIPAENQSTSCSAGNGADAAPTNKVDEIMPLLHQTCINEAGPMCDGDVKLNNGSATLNGGNARGNSHKSYRKRVKTKMSRKHVGFT